MDKDAQQIIAVAILFLSLCFGCSQCQKTDTELTILRQEVDKKYRNYKEKHKENEVKFNSLLHD